MVTKMEEMSACEPCDRKSINFLDVSIIQTPRVTGLNGPKAALSKSVIKAPNNGASYGTMMSYTRNCYLTQYIVIQMNICVFLIIWQLNRVILCSLNSCLKLNSTVMMERIKWDKEK